MFGQDLINSIASTVTGNKNVRRCKKKFVRKPHIGPKHLTNLIPNPSRPENAGPTHNSSAANQKLSKMGIFWELNNVTLEKLPPKLIRQTLDRLDLPTAS